MPIFHAYAHNASCQHAFSPRNIEGFGLTDGENVERLWSYLGRFAKMTKEMSSGNRIDLLSDTLSHYCKLKQRKLGKNYNTSFSAHEKIFNFYAEYTSIERFIKASKQLNLLKQEISDLLQKSGISPQQFQTILPLIINEEEARFSRDINQTSSMVFYISIHVSFYSIVFTMCRCKLMENPVLHSSV